MHVFIHSFTHDLFFIIKYHLFCARHYSRPQGDGKIVMSLGINNTQVNSKKLGSSIKEINNAVLFSMENKGLRVRRTDLPCLAWPLETFLRKEESRGLSQQCKKAGQGSPRRQEQLSRGVKWVL